MVCRFIEGAKVKSTALFLDKRGTISFQTASGVRYKLFLEPKTDACADKLNAGVNSLFAAVPITTYNPPVNYCPRLCVTKHKINFHDG